MNVIRMVVSSVNKTTKFIDMDTDCYKDIKTAKEALEVIAEQDRMIGMLTRQNERQGDIIYKFTQCQSDRKQEAGYEDHISFDTVWAETLQKANGSFQKAKDPALSLKRVSGLACDLLRKISEEGMCSVTADEEIHEFFKKYIQ